MLSCSLCCGHTAAWFASLAAVLLATLSTVGSAALNCKASVTQLPLDGSSKLVSASSSH